jgi:hypothetical protein
MIEDMERFHEDANTRYDNMARSKKYVSALLCVGSNYQYVICNCVGNGLPAIGFQSAGLPLAIGFRGGGVRAHCGELTCFDNSVCCARQAQRLGWCDERTGGLQWLLLLNPASGGRDFGLLSRSLPTPLNPPLKKIPTPSHPTPTPPRPFSSRDGPSMRLLSNRHDNGGTSRPLATGWDPQAATWPLPWAAALLPTRPYH